MRKRVQKPATASLDFIHQVKLLKPVSSSGDLAESRESSCEAQLSLTVEAGVIVYLEYISKDLLIILSLKSVMQSTSQVCLMVKIVIAVRVSMYPTTYTDGSHVAVLCNTEFKVLLSMVLGDRLTVDSVLALEETMRG
jgi:hypothetical protein